MNTFKDYCSKNPDSFLNRVCLVSFKRKTNGAISTQPLDALQQVFSEYLLYEEDLYQLTLEEVNELYESLENKFQNNFKDSYVNFFDGILRLHTLQRRLYRHIGIENYQKDFLNDAIFLGDVIEKIHRQENQTYLHRIRNLQLNDLNLELLPPEAGKFTNITHLGLDNNRLKRVDLSNFGFLLSLFITNNKLTNLDLSSNTDLMEV